MTTPELKPCPFCGGKPYLANVELVGCSYVVCTDCRVQGDDMSKDRAITSWNRRAPEAQELIRAAVEAGRERLQSERPFIMGANHGYSTAMEQVVEEAERFAEMYPQSSDGRNTFLIFAEWAKRMNDGPTFHAAIKGVVG